MNLCRLLSFLAVIALVSAPAEANWGGIFHISYTYGSATTNRGALTVSLVDALSGQVVSGAGWKLSSDSTYYLSGARKNNLLAGTYSVLFKVPSGYEPPSPLGVAVKANALASIVVRLNRVGTAPTPSPSAVSASPVPSGAAYSTIASTRAALQVFIRDTATGVAVSGARWRFQNEMSWRENGVRLDSLLPRTDTIVLQSPTGYLAHPNVSVSLQAGKLLLLNLQLKRMP